jgi:predicted nucleic acid-binding Zn ribbon protein
MRDSRPQKRDGKLRRLGHLVNEFLAEGNLHQRSISGLCAELWPQVVGPWYGKHTRVIGLKGKELSVWCDNPPLAQQLQYDQVTIVGRLNERLGGQYVESLRPASVGPDRLASVLLRPPEETAGPTEEELLRLRLTPQETESIAAMAARIPDPEMQRRYLLTMQRELRLRKWKLARGWRKCGVCGEPHNDPGGICFICRVSLQAPPRQGAE